MRNKLSPSIRRCSRFCKDVDEYNSILKQDVVYQFENFLLDDLLAEFKRTRRRTPITKKNYRTDIENYRKFIKEKQETQMNRLPICCNDHNEIERFKMEFMPILQRYSFLRYMISRICPKVLEPSVEELQEAISRLDTSRELGTQVVAKRLDAITPLSIETDRRVLKHLEYAHSKDGRVRRILNLDTLLDDEQK